MNTPGMPMTGRDEKRVDDDDDDDFRVVMLVTAEGRSG